MKVITYDRGDGPRAGVVNSKRVLDAAALLRERIRLRDVRPLLELPNNPLARLSC